MYKVCGIALQGSSHIKNTIPCQDKILYFFNENSAVVALSDGAGSAKLSHYGAESSVHFICKELFENFDFYFEQDDAIKAKSRLLDNINKNMLALCEKFSCETIDLAHTLLFVATKDKKFILFHIGDGVIGYVKDGEINVASKPMNGEFANSTVFATSPDAIKISKIVKGQIDNIDGFILMSDGASESFYDKRNNSLAKVLERLVSLNSLLPNMALNEKLNNLFKNSVLTKTSDDCSFCILSKSLKLSDIPYNKQLKLFGLKNFKRAERILNILDYLKEYKNISQIARFMRIKKRFIKKYLNFLIGLQLIQQHNNLYYAVVE